MKTPTILDAPRSGPDRERFLRLIDERSKCLTDAATLHHLTATAAWQRTMARIETIDAELREIIDEHRRGLPRLRERYSYGSATLDGLLSNGPAAVVRR